LSVPDPPPGHVALFRIVASNPPSDEDMLSQLALGHTMQFVNAKALRLWDGVSVYRTLEQARLVARRRPGLGGFLAELHVPIDGSVRIELDNGRNGHSTIWGEPRLLRRLIVSIEPV